MAGDSAVIVKTRKFKKNPLLARKQVRRGQTLFVAAAVHGLYSQTQKRGNSIFNNFSSSHNNYRSCHSICQILLDDY